MNAIAERIDRINPYALLGASIALVVGGIVLLNQGSKEAEAKETVGV